MKAAVSHKYGSPSVLHIEDVENPEVGDDDVLVRVKAASLNALDWRVMRGEPRLVRFMMGGLRGPKPSVRGVDVAGVVEAVGKNVTEFRPGDDVVGHQAQALAEYVCGTDKYFVPKPETLSFEEAAAIPLAGLTALQSLRDKGEVRAGKTVLVNGAAGGVGTFAVQIAKAFGAEVTGVCRTDKVELVRSLGADRVVDYTSDDFTRDGHRYDVILDNVANRSLTRLKSTLAPDGLVILVGGAKGKWAGALIPMLKAVLMRTFGSKKVTPFVAKHSKDDMLELTRLIQAGEVKPVVDRVYPLENVRNAFAYLEAGHVRGKVIVTV